MKHLVRKGMVTMALLMGSAVASYAQAGLQQDQPIQISADKLDVFQSEHKAIFSGNVIAVQGTTNMRAAEMVVFYRDESSKAPAATPPPEPASAAPQGIYRIEAQGDVVFTTPAESALGDKAIYDVDADTIDLMGASVTLTRGQNILKGTYLKYNMTTGRSVLTGGVTSAGSAAGGTKPARVQGLFVPKASKSEAPKP
jgi:lipopolysaccharide export system protein LptA